MSEKVDLRIGGRDMLHQRVCSVLRKAILKGDFAPGEKLVQSELAESIGVSRMPVREALRTLELEGLITLETHKGAVVRPIQTKDILEIYELRATLEQLALEKSVNHFTQEDLDALSSYHESMVGSESGEEYVEWNVKFHQLLFKRCDSPRLLGFIETLWNGFAQDTPQIIPGQIQTSHEEHKNILYAILKGDADAAGKYLALHIKRTGEELIASLENRNFR